MTTDTKRIAGGSTLVEILHTAVTQLRAWVAASWLFNASTGIRNALDSATDPSLLAEGVRTNVYWVRHSYLYRWLTKEPEPDVIVIDLRETYTVGPVIACLDRLAPIVGQAWRGSRAYQLTERLQTSPKRRWLERSRTLQLLTAALEPPEPPDDENRRE